MKTEHPPPGHPPLHHHTNINFHSQTEKADTLVDFRHRHVLMKLLLAVLIHGHPPISATYYFPCPIRFMEFICPVLQQKLILPKLPHPCYIHCLSNSDMNGLKLNSVCSILYTCRPTSKRTWRGLTIQESMLIFSNIKRFDSPFSVLLIWFPIAHCVTQLAQH